VVETARGQALADEYDIKFFETSAKTDTNVEAAFTTLVESVVDRLFSQAIPPVRPHDTVQPDASTHVEKKGCCS